MTDTSPEAQFAPFGAVETVPTSNFQRVVARRLTQSWTQIPHVTHHDDVDVTALDTHRRTLTGPVKISPLIFLIKALAQAMAEFPQFNASLSEDGKTLILKKYCHIGIAVDGPLGLLVPVLRDADRKDVATLAAELADFSAQARDKGLPMSAMSGGCMTITSLGGIGGTGFTPIINQPEVAILAVTPSRMQPVWDGAAFQPRLMMPLSLSYDHRVINGADAARFVRAIGRALAEPEAL
ncbi:MAG TPA: 2-oxo acid dehydrogenase subunit E2 [Sphingopyxis sp.]|nr:2-oxo acid dehydrogenase subunit E2 [Sphingopyxis sp.]HMP45856.1 2-oxo acid dehydrogenase subunit E2 [Sphingopyxis sp.]HMQ20486.1 2-oxo acid dehydrogenase subunit E2 [Sphingopyxis sp.]